MNPSFKLLAATAAALVVGAGTIGATTPPASHDLEYRALVAAAHHSADSDAASVNIPTQIPLQRKSVRALGSVAHRDYLVAESKKGLICLLVQSASGVTMTGCTIPPRFYHEGVEVTATGTSNHFAAFLAPAGVSTSALAAQWRRAGGDVHVLGAASSLVVVQGDVPTVKGPVTLHRQDGPDVTFRSPVAAR